MSHNLDFPKIPFNEEQISRARQPFAREGLIYAPAQT